MPMKLSIDDDIAVLRMEEPRGNAIGFAFIDALQAAFDEVERSSARALVLTGRASVFSVGLDLVEAWAFDAARMARFVDAFDELFLRAFALPLPTVAAVNGHAVAGGCILALACDAQIMTADPVGIGIHEVVLGIPFPAGAFEIARHAVPRSSWNEAFLEGRRFSPEEAQAAGIVEALVPQGQDVVAAARTKAAALTKGSAEALRLVKQDLKREALERARAAAAESRARFLQAWWSEEARRRIGALRDDLVARRS